MKCNPWSASILDVKATLVGVPMNDNTDTKPLAKVAILVLPPMILSSAVLAGLSTEQAEALIEWERDPDLMLAPAYGVPNLPVNPVVSKVAPISTALNLSGPIIVGGVAGVVAYRRPVREKRDEDEVEKRISNPQPLDEPQRDIVVSPPISGNDSRLDSPVVNGIIMVSLVLRMAVIWSIVLTIVDLVLNGLLGTVPSPPLDMFLALGMVSCPTIALGILIGAIARRIKISRNAGKTDVSDDTTTTGDGRKQKRSE